MSPAVLGEAGEREPLVLPLDFILLSGRTKGGDSKGFVSESAHVAGFSRRLPAPGATMYRGKCLGGGAEISCMQQMP